MSSLNRAAVVDRNFVNFCNSPIHQEHVAPRRALDQPPFDGDTVTGHELRELFESQITSRMLDLMARELRRLGRGFYTIGSSGHEPNAVVGRATRFSDPAFLHYRSGAFMVERARQRPEVNIIRETLHSFMASAADPISGGRHKVWGSVPLCVIPQTSTIASQLPRAMGAAAALARSARMKRPIIVGDHGEIPHDSIVVCNFGDASANHAAAQSAFNTTCYAAHQNLPMPVLYVCEDNGIGISVHTPDRWIESQFSQRYGMKYFFADGQDLAESMRVARAAADYVRGTRRPAFLHLKVVRLLGHAGTDIETEYHSVDEIAAVEARDPLLASARLMIDSGYMLADEVLCLYESVRKRVADELAALPKERQLASAAEIVAPLAPYTPDRVFAEATRPPTDADRLKAFELEYVYAFAKISDGRPRLPENQPPRHLAALINWALHDLMAKYPEMLVFGEDVAAKGGVYHVTAGLTKRFGVGRCFNTLLDETSILGMAIGAGHFGFLPMPEIQYLAYVHNAIDQLRGEACSTQFFSKDQFRNPMVVRINSLGYQKGFGGHFHNDNSFASLRDIPGIVMCVPARGDDAAKMLRTCMALARIDGRVVCFMEPIALYMTKDLFADGDAKWSFAYPTPEQAIPFGAGAIYRLDAAGGLTVEEGEGCSADPNELMDAVLAARESGEFSRAGARHRSSDDAAAEDMTILTFGNGLHMSLRAAKTLREQHGLRIRICDIRWIQPLNAAFIVEQALATGRVLVVDEGRYSGGMSEPILAHIHEHCGPRVLARRVVGHDTYVPLGPAANHVTPTEADVVAAALAVMKAANQSENAPVAPRSIPTTHAARRAKI
ncbi:MAG: thiamine pyrophosphate-dependent enzyme [Phycisphaerae bacterium]|nr:thiamine pyrophosphate-dependent enzyme [Phycisphaerae bacterium]